MIKLYKKAISGVLVGVAVFGCVGISSNAASKFPQEDRIYISSRQQKMDKELKRRMEKFLKDRPDKFKLVSNFGFEPVRSIDYSNFDDFARNVIKLPKGNYMASIGRVYVYFKVK